MSFKSTCCFLGMAVGGAIALGANSALAQIIPDATLPNNSTVTVNGNTFNITGGTTAGRNLFHSFQQFSVPTRGTASFNNAPEIQNIFSRVTGGSVSNIDGLIKANGTANLFLINPSGIIFGQNASLDVRGSFVGTTANAIQFGDRGFFSATNPDAPSPLLTINPSALLFNQIAAAPIQNSSSLSVPDGKSLLLVGGDISMNGGQLNAYGGQVFLGGLAASGTVGLGVDDNNISLSFPTESTRATVSLNNGANVDVWASGGGSITVNASNLNITGDSKLNAGIGQGLGSVGAMAGDITLNATGDIKIDQGHITNNVRPQGIGNGGNITLSSNSLSLTNGAQLQAVTFGQGDAGNVIVNATKSVSLDGGYTNSNGNFFHSTIFSSVGDVSDTPEQRNAIKGNGGNIQITTPQLSLTNGAQITAGTEAQGDSGSVIINATNSVFLDYYSVIFSSVGDVSDTPEQRNAIKGNAGNIQITTPQLSLTNGARLNASTLGQGNAGNVTVNALDTVSLAGNAIIFTTVEAGGVGKGGNININAATLSLKDGGQLNTFTREATATQPAGRGNAGNVNVKVSGPVDIAGEKNGSFSGIASLVEPGTVGNGGNITIDSGSFSLRDGALLTASTFGQGNAGTIEVNAAANVTISGKTSDFISGLYVNSQSPTGTAGDIIVTSPRVTLDNTGTLNAQSTLGNGGKINLQSGLLLLRRGAQISTTAGTAQQPGDGGNITINTPNGFIVSVPNENSDITANAFNGTGGVIKINALGIYNFNQRILSDLENLLGTIDPTKLDPQRLQTNDITAISLTSPTLSGQVNVITPDIDPARGLAQLPTVVVNTPKLISSGCAAASDNSFTITGRGGLPPSPTEPLTNDVVWTDARLPAVQQHSSNKPKTKPHTKPKAEPIAIVPATGWVFNFEKGEVTLISNVPNNSGLGSNPATCPTQ